MNFARSRFNGSLPLEPATGLIVWLCLTRPRQGHRFYIETQKVDLGSVCPRRLPLHGAQRFDGVGEIMAKPAVVAEIYPIER